MPFKISILLLILLIGKSVLAQETFPPPVHPLKIQAHRAQGKIILDGKLDEKDWESTPTIGDFTEVEPFQGKTPRFKTRVKILYDSTNLYIGAFCEDSIRTKKDIRVRDLSRDFDFQNGDIFGFRIDPFNGKRNCLGFDTNPYGVQRDLQAFDSQIFELNWNALWKVKTRRTAEGWYAEFAIPFTSLRYPNSKLSNNHTWNLIFIRIKRKTNEYSTFPALPRSVYPTRMAYGAELEGLVLPSPTANIQVQPYVLFSQDHSNIHDSLSNTHKPKAGFDLKWALNTHTQLDLTVNPDFAQSDIDQPVINLGRSAINYPEKRQFFLDNSGLFSIGIQGTLFRSTFYQPFYSRTIGLNSEGLPQAIQGGARIVDRTPKRTLGAMFLRQEGKDSIIGTDYLVARVQKNYGKEENIGFLLTEKYEEPNTARAPHISNTSFSINGLNHLSPNFNVNYLLSGTQELKDHSHGLAGSVNFNYRTNKWTLITEHHYLGERYNPALGFLSRGGVIYNNLSIERNFRSPKFPKSILQITPGFYYDLYQDPKTFQIQEEDINFNPLSIQWVNGANLFLVATYTYQNITDTFSPLHLKINPGKYRFWQSLSAFSSDLSKPLSIVFFGTFGAYYNGIQIEPNMTLRYSPDPHYVFSLQYDWGHFKHLGSLSQNIDTHLWVASTQIYYNPRLFFNGLMEYNSLNNSLSYNTKLTWEYSPLSFIYLVLTNVNDRYNQYQEKQFIAKISFIKQF